ncbi:MAG: SpoIID/LytB domain-containing protein [Phycisphaerales bacterium]|nr:SpoIID/LytB domain-containing protein [Phycisphaerales bacterium]
MATLLTVLVGWSLLALRLMGSGLTICHATASSSRKAADQRSAQGGRPLDFNIRVLLMERLADVHFRITGPYEVVWDSDSLLIEAGSDPVELVAVYESRQVRIPQLDRVPPNAVLHLRADWPGGIGVRWSDGSWRRYRGQMTLLSGDDGHGRLINVVDIETYLSSVVASELHRGFHPEAFRAQAIAARTYAWYQKQTTTPAALWDLRATQSSQVYLGVDREELVPEAVEAVLQTRGVVCTWASPRGQRIFCAYYGSTCGGCTQAGGSVGNEPTIPPLAGGVVCEYCRESANYRWAPVRIGKDAITERLRSVYPRFETIGPIESLEGVDTSPCGRPKRIALRDGEGRTIELSAENFRMALNPAGMLIKSSWFEPLIDVTSITLANGRGFGHGMGLCQYGADGLARAGASAGRIIRHYYPTTSLIRAYE